MSSIGWCHIFLPFSFVCLCCYTYYLVCLCNLIWSMRDWEVILRRYPFVICHSSLRFDGWFYDCTEPCSISRFLSVQYLPLLLIVLFDQIWSRSGVQDFNWHIQAVHFLGQVAFVQDTTWAFCVFLPECYLREVTLRIPGVSASSPTSTVHSSQGDFECLSLLFSLRFTKLPDVGCLRHLLSPCVIITN